MENNLEIGVVEDSLEGPIVRAELFNQGFSFVAVPGTLFDGPRESLLARPCHHVIKIDNGLSNKPIPVSTDSSPGSPRYSNDSGISSPGQIVRTLHPTVLFPYTPEDTELSAQDAIRFASETTKQDAKMRPNIWFHIPIYGSQPPLAKNSIPSASVSSAEAARRAYFWWHNLLLKTRFSPFISIALELDYTEDWSLVDRWLAEPVGCLIVPVSIFHRQPPELARIHRTVLRKTIQLNRSKILLRVDVAVPNRYLQDCLDHLLSLPIDIPRWNISDAKFLHRTMQPLHHNLSDNDYARFEEDRVKYDLYEEAVYQAMRHLRDTRSQRPGQTARQDLPLENEQFLVAVLGCGRGPLVTSVLRAAAFLCARVKVFALDKNPETQTILKQKRAEDWKGSDVELFFGDMREWKPVMPLDVIVSELIGNFGDDECSPECLEAPERLLKPDGISVPKSYTNFLAPVSATRLYTEVRQRSSRRRQQMQAFGVGQFNFLRLAKEQPLLSFSHGPHGLEPKSNARHSRLSFVATTDAMLHGFTGSFKVDLFGAVALSSVEGDETPGLFSWDAVFFPLIEPVQVLAGDVVVLAFRRRCQTLRVWYEWQLVAPKRSRVHNLDGEALSFRLDFAKD